MIQPGRACLIYNPRAGQGQAEDGVLAAASAWRDHGWQVELAATAYAGHATALARGAAETGYNVVIAAGGDGTINEVVNGLVGGETALAVLPVGTGNVWVRELNLPLDPRAAAIAQLDGAIMRLDVGQAGERYFLLMAGIGFDAAVTGAVRAETKRRFGLIAYLLHAVAVARNVRGVPVRLMLDGRPVKGRALMIVIGNSRLYGGFLEIAHHASPSDGLLDVVVIKGGDMRVAPLHLVSILLRRHHFDPDLDYYRARELSVVSTVPLAVQVDGDLIGQTPLRFRAVPNALPVLLPQSSSLLLSTAARGATGAEHRASGRP